MNYLLWMTNLVCSEGEYDDYAELFAMLNSFRFVSVIEHDGDRIADAEEMRQEYLSMSGDTMEFPLSPSILEVLVALARRLDSIIGYSSSSPNRWFWYMIKSLGLLDFKNNNFDYPVAVDILSRFISREFASDGRGSTCYYPCEVDFRKVDIWYQWMRYLNSIYEQEE